jgi:hypothetical protein
MVGQWIPKDLTYENAWSVEQERAMLQFSQLSKVEWVHQAFDWLVRLPTIAAAAS